MASHHLKQQLRHVVEVLQEPHPVGGLHHSNPDHGLGVDRVGLLPLLLRPVRVQGVEAVVSSLGFHRLSPTGRGPGGVDRGLHHVLHSALLQHFALLRGE